MKNMTEISTENLKMKHRKYSIKFKQDVVTCGWQISVNFCADFCANFYEYVVLLKTLH